MVVYNKKILHVLTATGHLKDHFEKHETKCSTLEDEAEAEDLPSLIYSFEVSSLLHKSITTQFY